MKLQEDMLGNKEIKGNKFSREILMLFLIVNNIIVIKATK